MIAAEEETWIDSTTKGDDALSGDLAVEKLRAADCTHFLLTLITDRWPTMLGRLQNLRKLRSEHEQLRRAIVGWHMEGPFLSAEPGFCGAHDPALMIDPKPEQMDELRKICGDDPVLVTIAPERLDAIATITRAVSLGMKVSLGHTNAPRKRLVQGLQAAAIKFTRNRIAGRTQHLPFARSKLFTARGRKNRWLR